MTESAVAIKLIVTFLLITTIYGWRGETPLDDIRWIWYKLRKIMFAIRAKTAKTIQSAMMPEAIMQQEDGLKFVQIVTTESGAKPRGIPVNQPEVQAIVQCNPGDLIIRAAWMPFKLGNQSFFGTVVYVYKITKLTKMGARISDTIYALYIDDRGRTLSDTIPQHLREAVSAAIGKLERKDCVPVWFTVDNSYHA